MMRILLVSSSSGSRGGGEIYLLYLGEALAKLGHEVGLWASTHERMDELCFSFEKFGEVLRGEYTNTYDLPLRCFSAVYFNKKQAKAAVEQWRSWKPDVVHLNKQNIEDGLDLFLALDASNIPATCVIHITQSSKFLQAKSSATRDWLAKRVLKSEGHIQILTVGKERCRELNQIVNNEKKNREVTLCYNGVPEAKSTQSRRSELREYMGAKDDELVFICVARLVDQKKPIEFLQQAKKIHSKNNCAKFVWIGDGELKSEWEDYVFNNDMSEYVKLISWQNNVSEWLAVADIYFHTAKYEGLPLAILEALSVDLLCIIPQSVIDEVDVFVAGENVISMQDDYWSLTSGFDPIKVKSIAAAGRELFDKYFSAKSMAERHLEVFETVLAAKIS